MVKTVPSIVAVGKLSQRINKRKANKKNKVPNGESSSDGQVDATTTTSESSPGTHLSSQNSRLILRNLPDGKKTRWDEAKIRAHFAKFGALTDVRLKLSEKTGAAKFAFVGFADAASCQAAIKKMNGAYVQGTKLQVEECRPLPAERTAITKEIFVKKIEQSKKGKSETEDERKENEEENDVDKLIESQILDTGRLFLRNLSYSCTEDQLRALCTPFGPLAEMECIVNREGKCKGFALCTFMFPEHALAAWKALDGSVFMGRMLHVIAGAEKAKKADALADAEQQQDDAACHSALQRERQTKRRKESATAKTSHTWNALFLGADAVAEAMAENYDVEKRHLLLEEGENSTAVRMAMAEARLVRETRKFLLAHGVRLDAFSRPLEGTKRSTTVILAKNLSAQQSGKEQQMSQLFGRFGQVKAVLIPPEHGICALVEMATARDAKRAFEALAYSKQHADGRQPLYLEWAPSDVFDDEHPSRAIQRYGYQNAAEKPKAEGDDAAAADQKQNSEEGGQEAALEESADREEKQPEKEPEQSKLLVRNVPFQATLKEVTQLFSTFGELKFIRMPKKPAGEGHRGFCFVDFVAVGDARRAMDSLVHSTHLYGRRLVLEWAKQDDTVDELRRKTARKMGGIGVAKKRPKMRSF